MMTLFNLIIAPFILGVVAHYAAIMAIGNHMEKNKTFIDFMADLQSRVYFCTGFVFLVWLISGSSSLYFILFMIAYFITFLRIDFSSVEEYYQNGKKDL